MHTRNMLIGLVTLFGSVSLTACGGNGSGSTGALDDGLTPATLSNLGSEQGITSSQEWDAKNQVYNLEAPIPPQCYTKTDGKFNPCMTCHQTYDYDDNRPNVMNDGYLQGDYDFSDIGVHNHWKNLFVDRSEIIEQISDDFILNYISQDNYSPLRERLIQMRFEGYIPDILHYSHAREAFDEYGFAKDGSHWVAFNYKPFPSTFWPTNGSTDDVLIRLSTEFRTNQDNQYQRDIYLANLAMVEMAIQDLNSTTLPAVDENIINADIDGNGVLEITDQINRQTHYFGQARRIEVHKMLYPEDTEFLHSVRYIGVTDQGGIFPANRMKELRYMKKTHFKDAYTLKTDYKNEKQEKLEGNLPSYTNYGDEGLYNGMGWLILGFIEDKDGNLRQQSQEENTFCMGCHTSIGSTIDQTFAFPRKITGKNGWKYLDLKDMQDVATLGSHQNEFFEYMSRVGGGDEFRENGEMIEKWFDENGNIKEEEVKAADIYTLITPTRERALKLNKAYYTIVKQQSFIYGRDANIEAAQNIYFEIDNSAEPLEEQYRYNWDIRLQW